MYLVIQAPALNICITGVVIFSWSREISVREGVVQCSVWIGLSEVRLDRLSHHDREQGINNSALCTS